MKRVASIAAAALALGSPLVASAQGADTFQSLANIVAKIFNAGAILLITATVAVYFYGIVGNIYNMSKGEARSDMRTNMLWGIFIIFLMVSIWGIVQFLQYSLFGGPSPSASNGVVIYH